MEFGVTNPEKSSRPLGTLVSAAACASHVVVLGGGVVEVGMLATKLGVIWVPLVGAVVQCLLVHWAPENRHRCTGGG